MNKISLPREGGIIKKGATFLGATIRMKESILVGGELGVPTNLNLTGCEIFLTMELKGSFDTVVALKTDSGITTVNAVDGEFRIDKIKALSWQKGVWSGIIEIKFPSGDRIPYIYVEITVS